MKKLAYLAPQITALSATFVYKEILGMEARGYEVLPVSVHPDSAPAKEVVELHNRSIAIYSHSVVSFIGAFFSALLMAQKDTARVVNLYLRDMLALGTPKIQYVKLGYQMLAGIWLAKKLTKAGIDHLHIHFGDVPTQIGMYAAAHAGIPFSFTIHANDLFHHGRLLKEKSNRACAVVTISDYNVKQLLEIGIPASKIHIVRCGINPEHFSYSQPGKLHVPPTVGVVARLVEKKGIDTLIEASAILAKEGFAIKTRIAGDGPELLKLNQLTRDLGIEDQVSFEGNIANTEVTDWVKSLDLFVLPAKKDANGDMDGIPVALMESMALGVPVVSTTLSGIPELVVDNVTGILVAPEDQNGLANGIKKLLQNKELRANLSKKGRQMITTEFNQALNLDRLEKIINQYCLGSRMPGIG